jgi:hypothetical protein
MWPISRAAAWRLRQRPFFWRSYVELRLIKETGQSWVNKQFENGIPILKSPTDNKEKQLDGWGDRETSVSRFNILFNAQKASFTTMECRIK